MAVLILLASFLLPLVLAYAAVRQRWRWGVPVLLAGFTLVGLWMIWKAETTPGWDGLGYALVALLVCAPGLLGTGCGGLIGWWRNARGRRKALATDAGRR